MSSSSNSVTLERRQFTAGLTSLLATAAVPSLSRRAQAAEGRKLGVAIVGLGGYAERSIAPEIASCANVRFAGVVTGDPEGKGKAWAAQYGFAEDAIYSYDTFDAIAEDDRIDFVHIALPNSMHAEWTIKATKAGKHVMVEKPMATSVADGEAMIAAAKEAGVLLGVNYRLHWEPSHLKAIEMLRKGAVGALSTGNYEFSWGYANGLSGPNADKIKKWLLDPEMAGGGALYDTGVYPIQAACYLTGMEPVAVRGMPSTRHPELFPEGVEETMSFELRFEDGFQALCRASYSQSFHQCTTSGPKGFLEILPGLKEDGRPGSVYGQSGGGAPNPKEVRLRGKPVPTGQDQTLQQAVLLDAFAAAIAAGDKTFRTPGEMGLRDLRIIEKIYESAAAGGTLVQL